MDYHIEYSDDMFNLKNRVRTLMADGWRCQGGVVVSHPRSLAVEGYGKIWYYQAMIRGDELESS